MVMTVDNVVQVTIDEWMEVVRSEAIAKAQKDKGRKTVRKKAPADMSREAILEARTAKSNHKIIPLTEEELTYVDDAIFEHVNMVESGKSTAWEASADKEEAYADELLERLKTSSPTLEDFKMLEFCLTARCDVIVSSNGDPMKSEEARAHLEKTYHVLKKISYMVPNIRYNCSSVKQKQLVELSKNRLSDEDCDYIAFALDDHMNLVAEKCSCPWGDSLENEKKQSYKCLERLYNGNPTKEDYDMLEFCMSERCDFLSEGKGTAKYKYNRDETSKTFRVLNKLAKFLGIPDVLSAKAYFF